CIHVSAFHQHNKISSKEGKGDYILFHGNLSVPENEKALVYLLNSVLSKIPYRVIIAGKDPGKYVRNKCAKFKNIELISNPEGEEMNLLVSNAHINLLYTYQPTGLKLKLLHSLYSGRFCLANPLMLSGSGLDELCVQYRRTSEAIEKINELMNMPFTKNEIEDRKKALNEYDNSFNAEKIISVL
ncbi:MAG: glycosyltransferase family 1 protein, partial [Bacteroidales bacterium]|nr:glycosyltransferase family 1 protein [Bacteroidales bacterium]